ncbi:ATP-binding protein [Rhizobium rhizoryzae]|uniref:ATP-binding protein n=2 Tax=Rhizobium rhizoryzae TaxID=451876 RepID=UPI0028A1B069|nr:AAA family ATPase [Rhizobium rhizoryzae]
MRLSRLDLTRYGKFTDRVLDFGARREGLPDLHIVYGLNEAGKSTAFSAYLDLLFGIPDKSSYDFLHAYSAMQIGGRLEIDGRGQDFIRIKKRTNALLDHSGQPLPEAVIASALGGLTRDSYRAMFSLDEHSLQDGGRAIVESKGDLGELLFSASAGLAELSRVLNATEEEAFAFHKKRARTTQLADLKQRLAGLKAERDEIDTYAPAFAGLVSTRDQVQKNYSAVLQELSGAQVEALRLQAELRALPLLRELRRTEEALAPLADLPRPPREWAALLAEAMRDETQLETERAGLAASIERLENEIAAIAIDTKIRDAADAISALTVEKARHITGVKDLEKRQFELAESQALLQQALRALGKEGENQPETLILSPALTGKLRDLIETRSGISATLKTVQREVERIEAAIELAAVKLADHSSSDRDERKDRQVTAVLERLRKSDTRSLITLEKRGLERLRRQVEQTATALLPWEGTADELRSLRVPEPRQMEAWRQQSAELDRQTARMKESLRETRTRLAETEARLAASRSEAENFDDASAAALRQRRNEAWQQHLRSLTPETAQAFDALMQEYDKVNDSRLSHSGELVEWRRLRQERQALAVKIRETEEALAEISQERTDLLHRLMEVLPFERGKEADIPAVISWIEGFSRARADYLSAYDSWAEANDKVEELQETERQQLEELNLLLSDIPDIQTSPADFEGKLDTISHWLAAGQEQARERHQQANRLGELKRDLSERQQDLANARQAQDEWHAEWTNALTRTWFAEETDPAAVRGILDRLADLPRLIGQRDQLAHRTELMARDIARFTEQVRELGASVGWAETDEDVIALAGRLERGRQEVEQLQLHRQSRMADLGRQKEALEAVDLRLAAHASRKAEFTSFFGVESLEAVSQHLERAAERDRLDVRAAELRHQLLDMLSVNSLDDAVRMLTDLDAERAASDVQQLTQTIENLSQRSRELYAELTRAQDKIDAVGGDDAVARLEARRATIILDTQDQAQRYLRLRAGTMAAETALSLYREKHRSSMMTKASAAFRQMTRNEYSGLSTQPDGGKEILIGVTRDGGSKLSDAMSTGTRYQLYLALRLAGYEEFAAVRPSIPFVADDIMETFDEPRSEEVFRLFGQMATMGQVIYLTHHRHLCDIARSVVPDVQIHEL